MKKLLILAALMATVCLMNASLAFDVGFYAPKDSKVNILWGLENFYIVDEKVTLGFTANYFYREHRDKYLVEPAGEYSPAVWAANTLLRTYFLPLYAGFKVHVPIEDVPVIPFAGADFGWGFAWKYHNAVLENGSEHKGTDFYHGFTWRINLGVSYPLGEKSELYVKSFYNDASFEQSKGMKKWNEFDLSGISIGLGIRFKY